MGLIIADGSSARGSGLLEGRGQSRRTLLDRTEGRDFTYLRALTRRYSPSDCLQWANDLDSGIRSVHIAQAFAKLARLEEAELPCDPLEALDLRTWYRKWSLDLSASSGEAEQG